ncbi:MAG: PsbP-related protein, partial [Halobacteriota archaeon]
ANTRVHWTIIVVTIAVIAVSSAGCTSNQATQSGVPDNLLLYTNKDAGVEIKYPSDWQLTGGSAVGTVAKFEHENLLFQIQRGQLNKTGQTPQGLAQEFISANVKGNVSLLENHSTSVGGLPAYVTVIKFKLGNETFKALTVFATKGDYVYKIQYSGTEAQYNEQNAMVQQMISSFKFK